MLHSALTLSNRKYIILDALDECTDRERLLPFIQNVVESQQYKVCLLATSRQEKDIKEELKPIANQTVGIQSAEVDHDICLYIHDQLATDPKLKKWPPSVKDEIASEMMKKADGMYV